MRIRRIARATGEAFVHWLAGRVSITMDVERESYDT
jgi:hypothetical protein